MKQKYRSFFKEETTANGCLPGVKVDRRLVDMKNTSKKEDNWMRSDDFVIVQIHGLLKVHTESIKPGLRVFLPLGQAYNLAQGLWRNLIILKEDLLQTVMPSFDTTQIFIAVDLKLADNIPENFHQEHLPGNSMEAPRI